MLKQPVLLISSRMNFCLFGLRIQAYISKLWSGRKYGLFHVCNICITDQVKMLKNYRDLGKEATN